MFRHVAKDPGAPRETVGRFPNEEANAPFRVWPGAAAAWRWPRSRSRLRPTPSDAASTACLPESVAINSIWVIVAALLVIFMQAGFAFLEIGFSRGKNVGTVVAKILVNFSIAAHRLLGGRLRLRLRRRRHHRRTTGFFLRDYGDPQEAFAIMGLSDATIESKWLFQFTFCAVSLAIVWGTTLERIKFGVYVIYAVVFAAFIYPLASHWVFGGGWLQTNLGMQDFAGSTAVHLIGATGGARGAAAARAAARQVRRRRQAAGDPRPQHAAVRPRRVHPVARLVRLQRRARRWARSTAASPRSRWSRMLGAAAGVLGASS